MKIGKLEPKILNLPSGDLPLEIRRHPTARRITLRLSNQGEAARLVLPRYASLREGLAFANSKKDWLESRLHDVPPRIPFEDGQIVPILGTDHRITHCPQARRGVWRDGERVLVSGNPEHIPRRVTDHLKTLARQVIGDRAHAKAAVIGKQPGRISLRDSRSRWGSCSHTGNLNFSWRLIIAPEFVLDYVGAHEVAHLAEHNHGPRFWALAGQLTPDMETAKAWLRRNGETLLRYG